MQDTLQRWLDEPDVPGDVKPILAEALRIVEAVGPEAIAIDDPAEAIRQAGKHMDNVAAKLLTAAAYIDALKRLK